MTLPPNGGSAQIRADREGGGLTAGALLTALLAALPACSQRANCFANSAGVCIDAGPDAAPDAGPVVSYAIQPENPVLDLTAGTPGSVTFTMVGVRADGSTVPVEGALFALATDALGTLQGGVFTATGMRAGTVRVTATAPGSTEAGASVASTDVTVRLRRSVTGSVPPETIAHFDQPPANDPAHASDVLYPLEGAVMPSNVAAPDVQWEIGRYGDAYRVRFTKTDVTVDAFVAHTGDAYRYDYTPDADAWTLLRDNDPGEPVHVQVDRWDATQQQVIAGPSTSFTLASVPANGAVYYWQIPPLDYAGTPNAAVVRGDIAGSAPRNLIPHAPSPPDYPRPTDPNSVVYCVGCHAVSRDGRYLSAVLGSQLNLVFDLTENLSGDPTPTVTPVQSLADQVLWYTGSFGPNATRLAVNQYSPGGRSNGLALVDARTGALVNSTGLPGFPAAGPDWSPDGNTLAYVLHGDDSEDGSTAGDLAVLIRTGDDTFGGNRIIHQGGDLGLAPERGVADSHTDWSPDARFLAFQHGPKSTLRDGTPGAIYVIPAAGGAVSRLNSAMGGPSSTDAYAPAFAPVRSSNYYWLAFYSRRDYGNAQAGTRGARRPQLWVTALDANFTPGSDPSHPAFWLPGQDLALENTDPVWAPLACRPAGEACAASAQCCSGNCAAGACAAPTVCRAAGETCGGDSDCCNGLGCSGAHACEAGQ